uniref:DUF1725 domain-containing protein n=1 Tax=Equus caballus TaxID=9796 RepID=A0A9L0S174_HORSE
MLERLWRKRNPHTPLVGMQTGAAAMENSMEIPQKIKNTTAIPLLSIYPKSLKSAIPKVLCTPMFIAALFTIAKTWKQPKCPSTDEWIKKMWYIYTMEYYSAAKQNKIIPFAITWMDLEGIMLSEISQIEKDNLCMTPLI